MSPSSRHDRVSEIFLAASEMPPEEREAFLASACAGDAALRAEVESLLEHQGSASPILETGAAARLVSEIERVPERIGPFRIERKLGEGGMGVVFLAEQERPVRRRVALKLIRSGFASAELLARFESEQQTLARMSHPNVATVFDAGVTESGVPYFAMEYVEGEPITTYCDRERVGVEARLALFCDVCDGVQHAHHKAIIHRDLKPANILVANIDGRPAPKVIDFGIAKPLDRARDEGRQTRVGDWLGTPEYISPEQSRADGSEVDTRSDVYSLGVLLYALLAGALPFDREKLAGASLQELRRIVTQQDPPRPSSRVRGLGEAAAAVAAKRGTDPSRLERRLRGDLDWIVLKAMAKEPERRYGSPSELAADIGRHLRHEPVVAASPGWAERTRKLARRHRTAAVAVSAAVALLVGFSGVMAVQSARIARERDRANAEAERATREAETAKQVTDFLVGLFEAADPQREDSHRLSARDLLDRGAEKVRRDLGHEPLLRGRLLVTLARVHEALDMKHTNVLYVEGIDALERTLGETHPETLDAKYRLGRRRLLSYEVDAAEPLLRDVIDGRRATLGPEDPLTLESETLYGWLLRRAERPAEGEALLRRTIETLERTIGDEHPITLRARGYLASAILAQQRFAEGASVLRDALPTMRRVLGLVDPNTLAAEYNLAAEAAQRGDRRAALDHLRRALEGGFWYAGKDPDGTVRHGVGAIRRHGEFATLRDDPEMESILGEDGYVAAYQDAINRAWLGDLAAAKRRLRDAVRKGFANADLLEANPSFVKLRSDPEFVDIVAAARVRGRATPP